MVGSCSLLLLIEKKSTPPRVIYSFGFFYITTHNFMTEDLVDFFLTL